MTPRLSDREFGVGGRVAAGPAVLGGHWAALGNQWAFGITLEELWASNTGGQGRGQAGLAASLPFCTWPF